MIAELQEAADFLNAVDEEFTRIMDDWLARVGISRAVIEAERDKDLSGSDT
jgi:hypothetical protein